MNVYEKILIKILTRLDELNKDETFIKNNPGFTAQEFLCARVSSSIKPKRLINILNGKAKRITTKELCIICSVLKIDLKDLLK